MFGRLRASGVKRSNARDAPLAVRVGTERYLTDGTNLYRVVDALRSPCGRGIGVEDCRSLEVLLPADELRALRLHPVRLAAAT
jgi:hypothetical protein